MLTFSILALVILGYADALPSKGHLRTSCDLSCARLQVPANQTQLIAPTYAPSFIGIGVGTQNYTCNATESTYALVGAVAELFDSSCLYGTPTFESAPTTVYDVWSATTGITIQEVITMMGLTHDSTVLGQHYYVLNPVGGTSHHLGVTAGNSNAYVIGAKIGDLPSSNSSNIDNLMVKAVEGELAVEVFRVDTNGGQPPTKCVAGDSNITVKYTAQYWFFQ
ncbi:hypothetical protein DFJ58DRAFT_775198 [Suillus subalutaceus]|uniref:uncharacterized protein n=1 Tax=Suillus subalutaceus TaxID=48586 RepID=UPI001B871765|nr:uncharacterized protein DFJ58DRAFT_775198 [Suillus subalutaceus]KAG1862800.1 hypothetical protein DFJ58DRAFT_775198 [Suillus subalutaceus]